jgi:hypothetical protein
MAKNRGIYSVFGILFAVLAVASAGYSIGKSLALADNSVPAASGHN